MIFTISHFLGIFGVADLRNCLTNDSKQMNHYLKIAQPKYKMILYFYAYTFVFFYFYIILFYIYIYYIIIYKYNNI